ncbi:hypothetical protein A2631_04765 [Candidatus Daviesbacteria bacterium RIFCSPHIGHO2_01_FULL_44_29]|uniref:Glycosyltransferase 2-like domain-containing protein n=1 Tax=Candidatus Daviesbacteria bacterium RIFCSPHIGHO2_02_FULL_43_12 TaxID=1797776 RepID=A0A1F5KGF6_9BACT|nr:MAG: hypothetical protein A2631_04765 [Candidatus Daviesbacteria bacterium RIFCSPHIGHO2_01_FULL_44_29]OGE40033.1 MAG: hypothetical protein A3D25_04495 [Candidatus Daviesbacteria bacterium RIFCSPHIGHO2_02_FULL_43_12]OGE41485.1 MAG: hypothetical protein A3E86_05315 [Candidatus Daviesbacteria bacterium RIFCSPHIGHO2_12_FULL_47_45]OGE70286.1 MAG: hypothetical protein A3B55_01075 [Candidatus Daviesbacteria bacterium RIFCSPLOWO2_01_FULL_43_15]
MRILLVFVFGLLGFFYLGEILSRLLKKPLHSIPGLFMILIGLVIGLSGHFWMPAAISIMVSSFLMGSGIGLTAHHLLSRRFIVSERIEQEFISRHQTFFERLIEIMPGALTWIALTSPFWLSFTLPFAVAYIIIFADVYWLLNSMKIAVLIYLGYHKMQWAKKQDWAELLKSDFPNAWQDYYHLIMLPTYKEPLYVLKTSFEGILKSNYPKEKIILVVGFESRDNEEKIAETKRYLKSIEKQLGGIYITTHPFGLSGEVPGQGSNKNWMINQTVAALTKRGLDFSKIFVTTLDADFIIHPNFLAGALHKYLSTPEPERDRRSYTGVFLYHNNYWQAPTPMRLIASGTAFWQMAEMVGSDKYINYSSLSITLKSLIEIGLWIPNKVNDDSGFFWKAYFHYRGNYKVIPHFLPISADAVLDVSLFKTFQNQYLQLKRWAYGVEHLPYIVREYFKRTDIDFWDKTDKLIFVIWANLKWGTLALFITFGGILIPYINPDYRESVLSINLPIISSWILTAAFFGLFATIYVHEKTAPPRPKNWGVITRAWSYIQWLLVPVVLVTISTLPAIDAQTSLMFGRYLEFRVTNKARVTET